MAAGWFDGQNVNQSSGRRADVDRQSYQQGVQRGLGQGAVQRNHFEAVALDGVRQVRFVERLVLLERGHQSRQCCVGQTTARWTNVQGTADVGNGERTFFAFFTIVPIATGVAFFTTWLFATFFTALGCWCFCAWGWGVVFHFEAVVTVFFAHSETPKDIVYTVIAICLIGSCGTLTLIAVRDSRHYPPS
ncbi:hypothetical protein D3C85_442290 [compost metagenome]